MAAIRNQPAVQARMFEKNNTLLLHCITNEILTVPVENCPAVALCLRVCHASFPAEIGVRRFILTPDHANYGDGQFYDTPLLISVESSCFIWVRFSFFLPVNQLYPNPGPITIRI